MNKNITESDVLLYLCSGDNIQIIANKLFEKELVKKPKLLKFLKTNIYPVTNSISVSYDDFTYFWVILRLDVFDATQCVENSNKGVYIVINDIKKSEQELLAKHNKLALKLDMDKFKVFCEYDCNVEVGKI